MTTSLKLVRSSIQLVSLNLFNIKLRACMYIKITFYQIYKLTIVQRVEWLIIFVILYNEYD